MTPNHLTLHICFTKRAIWLMVLQLSLSRKPFTTPKIWAHRSLKVALLVLQPSIILGKLFAAACKATSKAFLSRVHAQVFLHPKAMLSSILAAWVWAQVRSLSAVLFFVVGVQKFTAFCNKFASLVLTPGAIDRPVCLPFVLVKFLPRVRHERTFVALKRPRLVLIHHVYNPWFQRCADRQQGHG